MEYELCFYFPPILVYVIFRLAPCVFALLPSYDMFLFNLSPVAVLWSSMGQGWEICEGGCDKKNKRCPFED